MIHPSFPFKYVTSCNEVEFSGFTWRWIYRFKGKFHRYLVYVERYGTTSLYAVKFFPKSYNRSDYKYNLSTGDQEPRAIFNTVIGVLNDFSDKIDKDAVFCYLAAPTPMCEGYNNNRKFRFYKRWAADVLNPMVWTIRDKDNYSATLLFKNKVIEENPDAVLNANILVEHVISSVDWTPKVCPKCDSECEKYQKHCLKSQ